MSDPLLDYFEASVEAFDTGYNDPLRAYHIARRRQLVLDEVDRVADVARPDVWLDVGCGAGVLACDIAERGHDVFGCDFSPNMIEQARDNASRRGVAERTSFDVARAYELPYADESYGGIVCAGVIEYLEAPRAALAELRRVLRPDRPAIVTFNNAFSPFRFVSSPLKRWRYQLLGREIVEGYVNRAYSVRQATELLTSAGFLLEHWRRHTYTALVKKDVWLPPLWVARRLEALSGVPVLRDLAWGLVAVASRAPCSSRSGRRS